MKLILNKSIIEVEEITFASVGSAVEDTYSGDDVDLARSLMSMPLLTRLFLKAKYALFGWPKPLISSVSKVHRISMKYSNSSGKYEFTSTYTIEREAVEEFAVLKDFAKRLENKHAMDIISK